MGPPPARIDLPDVPDDQNPVCSCGRGKHMSDQFTTGRWKKICKLCRDEGVKAPKITGSMRRSLKKQASSRSLAQSFQPAALIPTKRPSEVPLFLRRGKHSQDTEQQTAARAEMDRIRRSNRVKRRAGEEPPPTPSLDTIMAGFQESSGLSAPPPTSQLIDPRLEQSSGLSNPPPTSQLKTPVRSLAPAPQPQRIPHTPNAATLPVYTPFEEVPSPLLFRRPSLPNLRGRGGGSASRSSSRRPSLAPLSNEPRPESSQSLGSTPPDSTDSPDHFRCDVCYHLRSNGRRKDPSDITVDECCYEDEVGDDIESAEEQYKWCRSCQQEKLRPQFWTDAPPVEYENCNQCAHRVEQSGSSSGPPGAPSSQLPLSSAGPTSTQGIDYASLPRGSYNRHYQDRPRPGAAARQLQANLDRLTDQDSVIPVDEYDPDDNEWKSAAALNDKDWADLQGFHRALEKLKLVECSRCLERWFDMKVNLDRVCKSCVRVDAPKKRDHDEPYMYSAANHLDPGDVPDFLPQLSAIEEMCIARVHCFVEVRQHRGVQFKYKGHVCNFLSNVGHVHDRLPLLPKELDIILIRPGNYRQVPGVTRQFKKDYSVRKSAIKIWLDYLLRHHPGYSDVVIDSAKIDAFPTSEDVSDQLLQHLEEDDEVDVDLNKFPEEAPEAAAIPDLHPDRSELAGLREDYFGASNPTYNAPPVPAVDIDSDFFASSQPGKLAGQHPPALPHLSLGSIHATPINEFNWTQAIFSVAFPTLFPNSAAEFITPRMREIGLQDYIRHLLLYKDGRFAQHSRFRYVGFNMLMRHQINSKSGFFVKKLRPEQGDLTLDDLKMAFQEDTAEAEAIINRITRFSSSLRGTRPFWYGALKQLQSTVRQLGCPSLFITLSAADYHWDSLMRLMPGGIYERFRLADSRDARVRVARDAVKDNPLIVDFYFYRRFQLFKRYVLKPKFNVVDSWDRFEYQARGSAHSHGLYWCEGVPANEIEKLSQEQRDHFANFWGIHIKAIMFNKYPEQVIYNELSPMSRTLHEMENTGSFLNVIINLVQNHRHSPDYCLTIVSKETGETLCRFNMPREDTPSPYIVIPKGKAFWKFMPCSNDGMLNPYNRLVTLSWLANTDVQPCTGAKAVIEYVGKYAAKPEKQSSSYKELAAKVLPFVNANRPFESFVSKVMNTLVGDRDWSAQEVCYLLLDLPLKHNTRRVINVNLRRPEEHAQLFFAADEDDTNDGRAPNQP
jgi:hypothetical protein